MSKRRGNSEGTIYFHEPKQLWCTQVSLGLVDGKRRRKMIYGKTRREVAEKLKVLLREQQLGQVVATNRQTTAQLLERWLTHVKPTVRPRTYDSYLSTVHRHLVPTIGAIHLGKLTSNDIAALLNRKEEEGLSPRTRQYIRAILRMALNYAVDENLIGRNVVLKAPKPRVERHEVRVLSLDEARRLLDAAKGDRFEALYTVALGLGLRQGEALGLRWDDVDFTEGTLHVRRSLQRIEHKLQLVQPKTDNSRRTIAMPNETILALREHRRRQLEEQVAAVVWEDHQLVFTTSKGTPLEKSGLTKRFRKLLEVAGLPPMRFHDLRHSCASILLAQGVPMNVVQRVLGHSSISVTVDIYGHLLPTAKQEAAAIMDAILTGRR